MDQVHTPEGKGVTETPRGLSVLKDQCPLEGKGPIWEQGPCLGLSYLCLDVQGEGDSQTECPFCGMWVPEEPALVELEEACPVPTLCRPRSPS